MKTLIGLFISFIFLTTAPAAVRYNTSIDCKDQPTRAQKRQCKYDKKRRNYYDKSRKCNAQRTLAQEIQCMIDKNPSYYDNSIPCYEQPTLERELECTMDEGAGA